MAWDSKDKHKDTALDAFTDYWKLGQHIRDIQVSLCLIFAYFSLKGFAICHGWEWAQIEIMPWIYPALSLHILILMNI